MFRVLNKKRSHGINQIKHGLLFFFLGVSVELRCKFNVTDPVVILTAAWLQPC